MLLATVMLAGTAALVALPWQVLPESLRLHRCRRRSGVCDAGDIQFNNVWIFNLDQLQSYHWIYDNQGLRVAQLRFCDVSDIPGACGSVTTVQ